jgi:hypothetical protein
VNGWTLSYLAYRGRLTDGSPLIRKPVHDPLMAAQETMVPIDRRTAPATRGGRTGRCHYEVLRLRSERIAAK